MPEPVSAATAIEYLVARGRLARPTDATAKALGGGVSNHVTEVSWPDARVIVKRPRANLAVDADWPADPARIHTEAAAARAYRRLLDAAGVVDVTVPDVIDEDHDKHVAVFSSAPRRYTTWKELLLAGTVDQSIAARLGTVLGIIHDRAAGDEALRATFRSNRSFEQLRLDPYHRATAAAHPGLAGDIEDERRRVASVNRTLVHGDFSPKNVLVDLDGVGPLWVIDFEVAHWGDPAFDLAFLANHLCIKALHRPAIHAEYLTAAKEAFAAYDAEVSWDVEATAVRALGVLMLARIDGKSPVEYVTDANTADTIRGVASHIMREEIERFDEVVQIVRAAAEP